MKEPEPRRYIPLWDHSTTRRWSREGLRDLRDTQVDKLMARFSTMPFDVSITGLMELTSHGQITKAALLARGLTSQNPLIEERIRETCGDNLAPFWLDMPLVELIDDPRYYTDLAE